MSGPATQESEVVLSHLKQRLSELSSLSRDSLSPSTYVTHSICGCNYLYTCFTNHFVAGEGRCSVTLDSKTTREVTFCKTDGGVLCKAAVGSRNCYGRSGRPYACNNQGTAVWISIEFGIRDLYWNLSTLQFRLKSDNNTRRPACFFARGIRWVGMSSHMENSLPFTHVTDQIGPTDERTKIVALYVHCIS
jgi:hypothetical protein